MERWIKWEKWKKLKKSDWLVIGLVGALLLLLAIPLDTSDLTAEDATATASANATTTAMDDATDADLYIKTLEERLAETIAQMEGAGRVRVMITLADEGVHVVEKDESGTAEKTEESTVYVETKETTYPYVKQEKTPRIEGVVVVAQGGDNTAVVSEIYDVVQALFSIEVHRIKVVKMSSGEDAT